jgi:hypothetical protein
MIIIINITDIRLITIFNCWLAKNVKHRYHDDDVVCQGPWAKDKRYAT